MAELNRLNPSYEFVASDRVLRKLVNGDLELSNLELEVANDQPQRLGFNLGPSSDTTRVEIDYLSFNELVSIDIPEPALIEEALPDTAGDNT